VPLRKRNDSANPFVAVGSLTRRLGSPRIGQVGDLTPTKVAEGRAEARSPSDEPSAISSWLMASGEHRGLTQSKGKVMQQNAAGVWGVPPVSL